MVRERGRARRCGRASRSGAARRRLDPPTTPIAPRVGEHQPTAAYKTSLSRSAGCRLATACGHLEWARNCPARGPIRHGIEWRRCDLPDGGGLVSTGRAFFISVIFLIFCFITTNICKNNLFYCTTAICFVDLMACNQAGSALCCRVGVCEHGTTAPLTPFDRGLQHQERGSASLTGARACARDTRPVSPEGQCRGMMRS